MRLGGAIVVGFVVMVTGATSCFAETPVPLPPVDLGQTNILDGEGGPGGLLEIINAGTISNRLKDASGNDVPGRNNQSTDAGIIHTVLASHSQIFGAYPGVELLVPFAYVDNDFSVPGSGSSAGIGDITVASFLQWSPQKPGPGSLSVRAAIQLTMPSGRFNANDPVNIGYGGWQVSPYVAATWRMTDKWELSARFIYDWSSNTSGRDLSGLPARVRAGDFIVVNSSISYELLPDLRMGLSSFTLQQLSLSSVHGEAVAHSRQSVNGIGPALRWAIGPSSILLVGYREFGARNRPEGYSANIRFQQPF